MNLEPSRPLRLGGWIAVPLLLALLATLVFVMPARVFGLRLPEPVWPMVLAFAWPLIRPSIVAPFALLLAGLFLDLLWGAALGHWALALLAAYGSALLSRPLMVGQGALVLAAWYAGLTLVLFGAAGLLSLLDLGEAPASAAVALQAVATLLLFPFAYWLVERYEDAGARLR